VYFTSPTRPNVTTGTYAFKIWTLPAMQGPTGTAFSKSLPFTVTGNASNPDGNLEAVGSVDEYQFTATANTKISIGLSSCNNEYVLTMPNGLALPPTCDLTSTPSVVQLPLSGQYTLAVSRKGMSYDDDAVLYNLEVKLAPTATTNITVPNAPTTPYGVGALDGTNPLTVTSDATSGRGVIEAPGNADVMTFNATAGQRYYLTGTESSTSMRLRLHQPDGDVYPGFPSQPGDFGEITFPLTGQYTLVGYAVSGATGTYTATLSPIPAAEVFPINMGSIPGGYTVSDGVPAVTGKRAGNIDVFGARDVYTFTAHAGDRVYLRALSGSVAGVTYWWLRDPDMQLVTKFDSNGAGFGDSGLIDFMKDGVYSLTVGRDNATTGTYSFNIVPAPAPDVFDIGDHAKVTTTTPTPLDPRTMGNIDSPGARDVYRFHGDAGERIYFQHLVTGANISWALYGVDGQEIYRLGTSGDMGVIRLPISGTYKVEAFGTSGGYYTATYSFQLVPIVPEKTFDLGALSSNNPVAVPNATTAPSDDGHGNKAGNIDVAGQRDVYTFRAKAGQQITFSNVTGATNVLYATLYGPDGIIVTTTTGTAISGKRLNALPGWTVAFARDGEYRLSVEGFNASVGAYTFTLNPTGAATASPLTQHFSIDLDKNNPIQTHITPNAPQVGAGLIEQAGAEDLFHINAESGDAIDIEFTKTDLVWRVGHSYLCVGVSGYLEWTVRDPSGDVIYDHKFGCAAIDSGPIVLPDTGTYTVAVGGADAEDSYDLTIAQLPYLREPAKAGQASVPALTRMDPAKGVAGRSTTATIFGKQMARPTAVHVVKSGVELPTTIVESHSVLGSSESVAAVVQIDTPANATSGNYVVSATLADGRVVQLQNTLFSVAASVDPAQAVITMNGFDRLRYGTINRAYVNITNPTDTDFLELPVVVHLPPATGDVTLVTPPHDFVALSNKMAGAGASAADVAAIRNATDVTREHPYIDAHGMRMFLVLVSRLAARATASLTFEMIPVELPPIYVGSAARQVTATVAAAPRTSALQRTDEGGGGVPCMGGESSGTGDAKAPGLDPIEDPWRDFFKEIIKELLNEIVPDDVPSQYLDYIAQALSALSWYSSGELLHEILPPVLRGLSAYFGLAAQGAETAVEEAALSALADALAAAAARIAAMSIAAFFEWIAGLVAAAVAGWYIGLSIKHHFCRSYDPNALLGPGDASKISAPGAPERFDGGLVHVAQRAYYTTEFENKGTAPAQMVDVRAHVSPQLDWSTFELDQVFLGATKVDMTADPNNPWHQHGTAQVPINNTTTTLTVDSVFNPKSTFDQSTGLDPGELHVSYAGPNAEDDLYHPSPYGDILPPNVVAPEGEGSFRFSAKVKGLAAGSIVDQDAATIRFDPHLAVPPAPIDTNSWQNTIANESGLLGVSLKLSDNVLNPNAKGVKAKLQGDALKLFADPTKPGQPNVTLRVRSEAGDSTYPLLADAGVWRASYSSSGPRLFKYTGMTGSAIRSVTIDVAHGKVNIVGRGSALTHSLAGVMPNAVDVVIAEGGQQFCAHFGGEVQAMPGRFFKAKKAPAPSSCPV
jgi:hypothetical protein